MQRKWQTSFFGPSIKAKGPTFEHSANRKAPFRVGGQLLGPSIKWTLLNVQKVCGVKANLGYHNLEAQIIHDKMPFIPNEPLS
jgi:hypothetical protein